MGGQRFYGQEYVAAVITTTDRPETIELTANRLERGRLPRTSYMSPWSVLTDSIITACVKQDLYMRLAYINKQSWCREPPDSFM